ncbi:MAG: hypothetical protein Q9180_008071, partial [Flavoplaca navasiana]
MSSPSRSPRPSPPPCPPPPPPSPQSPPQSSPPTLSPRSSAQHTAAIISAIDAGFPPAHRSRQEVPDSEDDPASSSDPEDPNASTQNAAPARTTAQQHRHLDSLPTYLANRALRNHHEADLEAAATAAESNASEGFDWMDLCEEAVSSASRDQQHGITTTTTTTTTTAAATNASAAAENESSSVGRMAVGG